MSNEKMDKKEESEFGRGLVVCLLHFANHWSNYMWEQIRKLEQARQGHEPIPEEEKSSLNIRGNIENLISSRITLWANGATDHLYEMEAPTSPEWSIVASKVKLLKDMGLDMGHGFLDRQYTTEDVDLLLKLSKEIAVEIDKLIGLSPELGTWQ